MLINDIILLLNSSFNELGFAIVYTTTELAVQRYDNCADTGSRSYDATLTIYEFRELCDVQIERLVYGFSCFFFIGFK